MEEVYEDITTVRRAENSLKAIQVLTNQCIYQGKVPTNWKNAEVILPKNCQQKSKQIDSLINKNLPTG